MTTRHATLALLATLGGCSQELRGVGTARDGVRILRGVLEIDPAFVVFGEVEEQARQPLTLRNVGDGDLEVEAVFLRDDRDGAFDVEVPFALPHVLEEGAQTPVDLVFRPQQSGLVEGTLVVRAATAGDDVVTVPVNGIGPRGATLTPGLEVSPLRLDFGLVPQDCTRSLGVRVSSTGTGPLTLDLLEVAGDDRFALEAPPALPVAIDAGDATVAVVRFEARQAPLDEAVLTVRGDDPAGAVQVPLTGEVELRQPITDTFVLPDRPQTDLVFTLDQSGSMEENLPVVADEILLLLDELEDTDVDWRLGLLVGRQPSCYIGGVFAPDRVGWRADLEDTLDNLITPAIFPPLTERGLEMVARATRRDGPGDCNDGFHRPHATFQTLLFSDERDQSAGFAQRPALYWQDWVAELEAYAGSADRLTLHAAIDLDTTCGDPGEPNGPQGYLQAVEATGGVAVDICAGDVSGAFAAAALDAQRLPRTFALTTADLVPDTVAVTVDGTPAAFTYDAGANAVILDDEPPFGSVVAAIYEHAPRCTTPATP